MSRLEAIREYYIFALDKWSVVLDKALLKFPNDKLNYKLTEISRTVAEIATHVYQMIFMYAYAVENDKFHESDFQKIPFKAEDAKSSRDIYEYGQKVKKYARKVIINITDEDLNKDVWYGDFSEIGKSFGQKWENWSMNAKTSLDKMMEDVIHHRSQLFLYLRFLEIPTPFIYDYSPIQKNF